MPQVDTHKFGQFATIFKNQDPKIYEQFIRLLDAYVTELTVAVTEASSDQILIAQGQARQGRKFLQLLTEFREVR